MSASYDIFETPLGWMGALATPEGLRRTTLPQASPDECYALLGDEVRAADPEPDRFEGVKAGLARYFLAEPMTFDDEPIDVHDSPPFHREAWKACRSIPRGETRSYKWLAANAGRPAAARAAGQAMARNPLPIIVPCHRVIASDGHLGGFGRGSTQLELKAAPAGA